GSLIVSGVELLSVRSLRTARTVTPPVTLARVDPVPGPMQTTSPAPGTPGGSQLLMEPQPVPPAAPVHVFVHSACADAAAGASASSASAAIRARPTTTTTSSIA